MDAERFDFLTRRLSAGQTRRQALGALGAIPALWTQRGRAAQLGPPPCGSAGKVCTMLAGCCDGLTCVTSSINANYGVCVSGGSGGTVASGTSLVSPFSEAAQATGTVDSPTTDTTSTTTTGTTTTGTTTTSTTDPKAERQAKLQERRTRRSTQRNKIQSRRTTKATSRKTRREDAADAAVLAAGPELEFDYFRKEPTASGPQEKYEELRVTNVSDFSAIMSSVKMVGDTSDGTSLSRRTISSGGSLGLVSGRQTEVGLASDQFFWVQGAVCAGLDPSTHGWIVKAAFSGEVENRTYTILCDGSVNGVPLSSDSGTTNNRKKRKRKQQQQAASRRKKRKQNKKDH